MSFNQDGTTACDHCGGSAGNGGVLDALVLADLNFDTGYGITYHLCRNPENSPMCCDLALSNIPGADAYSHIQPS
jgi:hypothetical protein